MLNRLTQLYYRNKFSSRRSFKRAFIVGASRGLGVELSEELAQQKVSVIAGVRELPTHPKEGIEYVLLDLNNEASVEKAFLKLAPSLPEIDLLIHNGAINLGENNFASLDIQKIHQTLQTNLIGHLIVLKKFLPLLKQALVLNISSDAALLENCGRFQSLDYGLSKAATLYAMKTLAHHPNFSEHQILNVHPGWLQTDMGGPKATTSPREAAKNIVAFCQQYGKIPSGAFVSFPSAKIML